MRHTIETAPKNGKAIIIMDDANGTYDIAHWSPEAGEWVGENGEPVKITPSHWIPMQRDNNLPQGDGLSSSLTEASPSASRARRDSFLPFSSRRAARQQLTAGDAIAPRSDASAEAQTGPAKGKRALHGRRRFTTSSIGATLVAAALIGMYFRSEVIASVTRYADLQDISRIGTIGEQLVEQATELLSQGPVKAYLRALQEQAEADQVSVQEAAAVKQALPTPAPEPRQSSENEPRQGVLAKELAEARRAVDGLNLKLQAEAATAPQSLGQEREKTTALMQDADAARQALTASTVQHRQALEEERARSDALASELATVRRDFETKVALSSKTPTGGCMPIGLTASGEIVFSIQCKEFIERQRGQAVEQKPAAVEERPGVSLPAWANSDAFVKPAQTAKQPDVAPEDSTSAIKPVETVPLPKRRPMSQDDGYSCQHNRTYDPASGTYKGYDGQRHSCP